MSKAYWSGPGRGTASRFADDPQTGGENYGAYSDQYDPPTEDLGVYQDYDDYRPDTRWRWVAALAAVVLLIALVSIAVASRGGDSSTSATPSPSAPDQDAITATTPRTVIATNPPAPSPTAPPAPTAELPPETIVTVTPSPSAEVPPPPAPAPLPEGVAPGATITYTVTGTRQLFDLVTIIYTDEQGFPRTDVNVALPWTKTFVLNPGVTTRSVTATSLTGQLNCTVTDGTGATLAAQTNNAAITTCTP